MPQRYLSSQVLSCCCFLLALSLELQSCFLGSAGAGRTGTPLPHTDNVPAALNGSNNLVVLNIPLVLELCTCLYRKEAFMITTTFSSSNTNTRLLQQQLQQAAVVLGRDNSSCCQLCEGINQVNALISSSCAEINLRNKVCLNVFRLN